MKLLLTIAISLCIALPVAAGPRTQDRGGIPDGGRVGYYAHMPFRETPFADLRGIYPISVERAQRYKHYRFIFDAAGRVVEVSFRQGNELQDLNLSRNALTFTPVIRIAYAKGKETRVFFDRHMNPTTANGVFREEYTLDEDGNRVRLTFYDVEGRRIESDWGVYEYRWQIDRRGVVTEQRVDREEAPVALRPGFPFYCLKLSYDQRGWLALMENFGFDCSQLTENELNAAQDKLEYNAKGGIYAWNVYDDEERRSVGNGPRVARGIMERNSLGHTTREYYEDEAGDMITNAYGWTDTYAKFDRFGNMVERWNQDIKGELVNNPDLGYARYTMHYDRQGENRKRLRYFDASGEPAIHARRGYHSVFSIYDAEGNRSSNRFEDANGNLVERADNCAAVYKYEYDDVNRRISTRLLDRNLEPTEHCEGGWHERRYYYHPDGPLSHTETSGLAAGVP